MAICRICATEYPEGSQYCPGCGWLVSGDVLPAGHVLQTTHFRLEAAIGRGSIGITYRGFDTARNTPVAIKEFFPRGAKRDSGKLTPPPYISSDELKLLRERFKNEARALSRFRHNHTVMVYQTVESGPNGFIYMVMEYVNGESLEQRLQEGPLPTDLVMQLARQLGSTLAAIHQARIFHCDIQPANVMIDEKNQMRAVLVDFGVVRTEYHKIQQNQAEPEDDCYTPPEHVSDTPRSDLYELGATLIHALTGQAPPTARARLQGAALPALPDHTPRNLRKAILSALELDPGRRPKSAEAWLAILNSKGVLPWFRLGSFWSRTRS